MKNITLNISRRRFLGGLGIATLAISPLASLAAPAKSSKGAAKGRLSPLNMQSPWTNDAEFLGYFIAIDKGWYQEEGLNFTYLPGGPEIVADTVVWGKKANVALTTPDTTVNAIVKQGAPFKVIGAQYQKNPLGVVSLKRNHIEKPSDLVGRSLAVPPANMVTAEAMLKINGIPIKDVRVVPYQYDPTPLIRGEVDATIDFVTNVPFTIRAQGEEPTAFLLYDVGFKIFQDTVVVLEETLKSKRKELISFLKASRRGWEENFKDPEKYPTLFKESFFKDTGRTIENEIFFNRAQQPLIESSNGIFSMSEQAIAENIESLNKAGLRATREMFVTDIINEL